MNIDVKISVPKNLSRSTIKDTLVQILPLDYKIKSVKLPTKPGSGRRRGGVWELTFCKELSLWWTNGKDKDVFKRAGSLHTVAQGHVFGDVYAVKPEGFSLTNEVAIELKVVKDTRVESANLLCGKSKMFDGFWKQTVRQAEVGHKRPILVVKIDRHCTLVFNLVKTLGVISLAGCMVPFCTLGDWLALTPEQFITVVGGPDT